MTRPSTFNSTTSRPGSVRLHETNRLAEDQHDLRQRVSTLEGFCAFVFFIAGVHLAIDLVGWFF